MKEWKCVITVDKINLKRMHQRSNRSPEDNSLRTIIIVYTLNYIEIKINSEVNKMSILEKNVILICRARYEPTLKIHRL